MIWGYVSTKKLHMRVQMACQDVCVKHGIGVNELLKYDGGRIVNSILVLKLMD